MPKKLASSACQSGVSVYMASYLPLLRGEQWSAASTCGPGFCCWRCDDGARDVCVDEPASPVPSPPAPASASASASAPTSTWPPSRAPLPVPVSLAALSWAAAASDLAVPQRKQFAFDAKTLRPHLGHVQSPGRTDLLTRSAAPTAAASAAAGGAVGQLCSETSTSADESAPSAVASAGGGSALTASLAPLAAGGGTAGVSERRSTAMKKPPVSWS